MAAPRRRLLLLLLPLLPLLRPADGGCQEAGLCCSGRDAACSAYGDCYCDQACVSTRDCCHDYHVACPAVSCVVSEWSAWSGCAEPCRATIRVRQRRVLQEPRHGGQACPALQETAGCAEYRGRQGRCRQSMVPALITTAGYGNARKKREVSESEKVTGYCVQFQLTSLTAGCGNSAAPHTRWMQYLREGHQVCVECQPPALSAGQTHCSGDGENITGERTEIFHWQAVGNPRCRGEWRRVHRLESCSCPTMHSFLFI
ncbi:somatomedin-B and thrombospondin type-1 domain-containing protein [Denticeps clupeoides]|uniref:SMB domain-containing protein n=1 Tax=Denticeps clupeoides TaxID=299321 RepID=A0AAY4E245_9TELE|nr:somatomedin-B and thrombospondin type-1 domain-containing protein-like [Denticeps clupeoides]XP_028853246.1 somatomedin-B and thrombospondin type-1 domain-containing protein-like [Denticeps clupeoides]